MILLRDSSPVLAELQGAVMALGNFDGLHLGHRGVIAQAAAIAKETARPFSVMTFEPHPRRVFTPGAPPLRIQPLSEKLHQLRAMDIDFLRIVRFTRAFADTSPEDFVTRLLHENLRVSHVVTGEDFVFGRNRKGNAATLSAMAARLGFTASTCPPVMVEGERCSSTRIREALALGDMKLAANLLGRPYKLSGHVKQGDRRGRSLGFPTVNLLPPPVFLPARGVYAVRVEIGEKHAEGVANLGLRPTFAGSQLRLEAHLFDWNQDIYGEFLQAELVRYLRPEQKFDGIEVLKNQIAEDCAQAKAALRP